LGLFSFLKKKEAVPQPSQPAQFDVNQIPSDIPPIDGNQAQASGPTPIDQSQEPLPQYGQPLESTKIPSSMDVDVYDPTQPPTMPMMPGADSAMPATQQDPQGPLNLDVPSLDMPSIGLPPSGMDRGFGGSQNDRVGISMPNVPKFNPRDVEDSLNSLFIADSSWKEPDWTNYNPYMEEKIEEPTMKDFSFPQQDIDIEAPPIPEIDVKPADNDARGAMFMGSPELQYTPQYAPQNRTQPSMSSADALPPMPPQVSGLPEFEDEGFQDQALQDRPLSSIQQPPGLSGQGSSMQDNALEKKKRLSRYQPMDLYVKGSDYESIVHQLKEINDMLAIPEPGINITEDIIKKQDPELSKAKENMEYLYKKFTMIDKRIFNI
jgi:hypothetical protein